MPSYEKGFRDGWRAAHMEFKQMQEGRSSYFGPETYPEESTLREMYEGVGPYKPKSKPRKGKDPTPTLTKMTAPIWKKYKKGRGKKTYFDIKNQVRRSQKYKKAKKTRGP